MTTLQMSLLVFVGLSCLAYMYFQASASVKLCQSITLLNAELINLEERIHQLETDVQKLVDDGK